MDWLKDKEPEKTEPQTQTKTERPVRNTEESDLGSTRSSRFAELENKNSPFYFSLFFLFFFLLLFLDRRLKNHLFKIATASSKSRIEEWKKKDPMYSLLLFIYIFKQKNKIN